MRCVIIEDELPAQRIVQNYISKLPDLELMSSFQSALEANSFLQKHDIDVIFLDINLPDISGLHYIKTLSDSPCIIMTTAYHEHAVESFELDTICDYLVKPFSFERFLKAVNKARKNKRIEKIAAPQQENHLEVLFLNIDKTLHKIVVSSILYIESDKNYVTVVTEKEKLCYLDSLKNWMGKLPPANFVQVHKSYIVNYGEIKRITGNLITISNNKIPVGRTYKTALFKKLNLYPNRGA
ncbi:Two-component transcriptional response regulator, LuxR family [hydrothermal vent metagenome]|uniref:Two-component transcriptional response regulator, LuxR family n=1 Tax=hydrothermal vent metagenome TaxID=652676 RepID=A0A3B0T187_9ZZZZ